MDSGVAILKIVLHFPSSPYFLVERKKKKKKKKRQTEFQ